jgi:alkaline phosphatase isozyme conversion protein
MRRTTLLIVLVIVSLSGSAVFPALAQGMPDFKTLITADQVMAHVSALSVDIGTRVAGTEAEVQAADYIAAAFESWGYAVETQEFTLPSAEDDGADGAADESAEQPLTSRNVIATRAGDDQMVVVGAHMDSVSVSTGGGDNASGVAAMLGAAEALADIETQHTLVFVAFGAEEAGLVGSHEYVDSLGDNIHNVIAMINLDSVGVGSQLNVYAGALVTWPDNEDDPPQFEGGPTWVRDTALDLAAEMGLPFGTTPATSWNGFTGDWSDHYAFVEAGVPIAYFEAFGWEGADDPWWGIETPEGEVMHTAKDTIDAVVPGKVEMTAEVLAATTYVIASGQATGD